MNSVSGFNLEVTLFVLETYLMALTITIQTVNKVKNDQKGYVIKFQPLIPKKFWDSYKKVQIVYHEIWNFLVPFCEIRTVQSLHEAYNGYVVKFGIMIHRG